MADEDTKTGFINFRFGENDRYDTGPQMGDKVQDGIWSFGSGGQNDFLMDGLIALAAGTANEAWYVTDGSAGTAAIIVGDEIRIADPFIQDVEDDLKREGVQIRDRGKHEGFAVSLMSFVNTFFNDIAEAQQTPKDIDDLVDRLTD